MQAVSLYSTWPDMESAEAAGEALVAQRLAACVNILPGARSIYRWDNVMQHDQEVVMFAKTTRAQAESARQALLAAHPYDTPCVLEIAIGAAGSNPAFLAWIEAETGSERIA